MYNVRLCRKHIILICFIAILICCRSRFESVAGQEQASRLAFAHPYSKPVTTKVLDRSSSISSRFRFEQATEYFEIQLTEFTIHYIIFNNYFSNIESMFCAL
jgi:hypothetical protein